MERGKTVQPGCEIMVRVTVKLATSKSMEENMKSEMHSQNAAGEIQQISGSTRRNRFFVVRSETGGGLVVDGCNPKISVMKRVVQLSWKKVVGRESCW